MKALKNFLRDLRKSEITQLESDSILMVSEHEDYYIVFSWDDQDNVYLVNHFYKESLDFDHTHSWTESYNEAFQIFSNLVLKKNK